MERKEVRSTGEALLASLQVEQSKKHRILLVEDDTDIRGSISVLLENLYDVMGLSNGDKLLEMIECHDPSLIILDINLPRKNGFELCQMLRSSPPYQHLPVIFLTVRRDEKTFVESIESDADAFLNKPFDKDELKNTIERLILRA